MGNFSYSIATKFYVLYSLASKVGEFIINEIILNAFLNKSKREKLIEEKTKEFNHKNMIRGYFLALNEDVILLFKIKEKYKSFDESYSILYEEKPFQDISKMFSQMVNLNVKQLLQNLQQFKQRANVR